MDQTTLGPQPHGEDLVAQVKLVIWDLDDTLWQGTLSEGAVVVDPAVGETVRTLNDRGILNSICSKNDRGPVEDLLRREGLWEEFVFTSVDWTPKGDRIAGIIEAAQLRPENVLFLDDAPLNLAEARRAAPGVQTGGPELVGCLLDSPHLAGKDDRARSRLSQYRILERRWQDRTASPAGHEAFLRECDIRLEIHHDRADADRIAELVGRTHQLNFTKRRPGRAELDRLLDDPAVAWGTVHVRDRYGDHGLCGFYALAPGGGRLTDFLFSCRILHMGVEQWIYQRLGRPEVRIEGEVASELGGADVDWITEGFVASSDGRAPRTGPTVGGGRVLMLGGCDLNTTAAFLGGSVATEFAHPVDNGLFVHAGHTETLRQAHDGLDDRRWEVVDRIPFTDRSVFSSRAVLEPDYDVLVLSLLTDYTQGLYRHRTTGLVVPWNQFDRDVLSPGRWEDTQRRLRRHRVDDEELAWLASSFEFVGGTTPERLVENIRWLAALLPDGARLVLVNGTEVPFPGDGEPDRHLHHRRMNAAVDAVVADLDRVDLCDVRTFVTAPDDFTDSIRHYQRRCYLDMARAIEAVLPSASVRVTPPGWTRRAASATYRFAGRRRLQARKAWRRVGTPGRRTPSAR